MNLTDLDNISDDFDQQNFEYAMYVFEQEESRKPDMNDVKDMNAVAILEVGIRYTRNNLTNETRTKI
jgi:hypothetical protein